MGKAFRWILALLAVTVFTAIVQPWLVTWLTEAGWYSTPLDAAKPVVNWIARIIGDTAFPWLAGIILGMTIGAWVHFVSTKFDKARPSKEDEFFGLRYRIESLASEIMDSARKADGSYDLNKRNYQVDLKIISLFSEIRTLGIETPDYSGFRDDMYNIGNQAFLQCLVPFSEHGQLKLAKRIAKKSIAEFKDSVNSPQPPVGKPAQTPQ